MSTVHNTKRESIVLQSNDVTADAQGHDLCNTCYCINGEIGYHLNIWVYYTR